MAGWMLEPVQLVAGVLLGTVVAAVAWRAGMLNRSGALAAALLGAMVFGFGGWPWAIGLLLFFTSSSLLSRLFKHRKQRAHEKFSKGARRDWAQAAANGGAGAALAVVHALLPHAVWPWAAFLGAMAAVNADTWATELGVLAGSRPRKLTTWEAVDPGTSGAISGTGLLASLAGAVLIGLLAWLPETPAGAPLAIAVTLAGLLGSLFDSWLGASFQAMYFCPREKMETEQHPHHSCGEPTHHLRGARWLSNDLVNLGASIVGAASAALLAVLLTG